MWISPKHPSHNEVTRNCSCHWLDLCSQLLWRSHCFKHRHRFSQILKIHHHIWEHLVQLVRVLMPTATGNRNQSAVPELTGAEALKHSVQLWVEREVLSISTAQKTGIEKRLPQGGNGKAGSFVAVERLQPWRRERRGSPTAGLASWRHPWLHGLPGVPQSPGKEKPQPCSFSPEEEEEEQQMVLLEKKILPDANHV